MKNYLLLEEYAQILPIKYKMAGICRATSKEFFSRDLLHGAKPGSGLNDSILNARENVAGKNMVPKNSVRTVVHATPITSSSLAHALYPIILIFLCKL